MFWIAIVKYTNINCGTCSWIRGQISCAELLWRLMTMNFQLVICSTEAVQTRKYSVSALKSLKRWTWTICIQPFVFAIAFLFWMDYSVRWRQWRRQFNSVFISVSFGLMKMQQSKSYCSAAQSELPIISRQFLFSQKTKKLSQIK